MRYLRFVSGPRMGTKVNIDRLFEEISGAPGDAASSGQRRRPDQAAEPVVGLGRERSNAIPIDDLNMSRRHAEIFLRDGRAVVRDFKSTNGTFVNGRLVEEHELANGDQITIGDTVIVYEETTSRAQRQAATPSESERPGTRVVTFHDGSEKEDTQLVRLDPRASQYLDPALIVARPEAAERLAKLYRFISEVAPVVSPERLGKEVLDRAFEAIRADRGFIMLLDETGRLRPEHMRVRDPAKMDDAIQLSRRMTQQVLESGQSILSSDTLHDGRFKDSIAFTDKRVNSFVCAPLKHRDRVIGLLYVETAGMTEPLIEDDLELVSAMALLAGTQFANARYYADIMNSAEHTQSILRCLHSGVVVTDLDLKIRQLNDAACRLFKRREQELVGRSFTEFKALRPLWRILQETVRSGIPCERQEVVVEVAGEQVPLGVSTSLLRDHENRLRGVVASFRSLKIIKKLSEQVRMAQHLAVLGEMAAGIAHEIRNPLNSIRGFAQLLGEMLPETADSKKLETQHGYLNIIVEEVDRMNRLVQDLLDFSRQRELTMMETDIGALVEDTLRELAPDITEAAVEIVWKIPEDKVHVIVNSGKLKQVLVNIIRNAIQAVTPPVAPEDRARRLEVSVSRVERAEVPGAEAHDEKSGRTSAAAVVAVADSGMGMDKATLGRIFEPFFTTRDHGTGLGLAICRKIMQQHGGTIQAESRIGQGSTFRIVLPLE